MYTAMCRVVRRLGVKEATDGADQLQQLLQQLLLQLIGQRSGHQEPGDPEGALVKHQVGATVASVSPAHSWYIASLPFRPAAITSIHSSPGCPHLHAVTVVTALCCLGIMSGIMPSRAGLMMAQCWRALVRCAWQHD